MKNYLVVFVMLLMSVATTVGSEYRTDAVQIENQLVFTTPMNEGIFTDYLMKIFHEVGNRIGIPCTIIELPNKGVCQIQMKVYMTGWRPG